MLLISIVNYRTPQYTIKQATQIRHKPSLQTTEGKDEVNI